MSRRRRTMPHSPAELVTALRALPEAALVGVLDQVGAVLREPGTHEQARPRPTRLCGYCREPYVRCRALWADDHEWEGPTVQQPAVELDDEAEQCCPTPTLDVSGACSMCGTVVY